MPDVDTVGMTILPGYPMPEWADPESAAMAGPEPAAQSVDPDGAQGGDQHEAIVAMLRASVPGMDASQAAMVAAAMAAAGVTTGAAGAAPSAAGQAGPAAQPAPGSGGGATPSMSAGAPAAGGPAPAGPPGPPAGPGGAQPHAFAHPDSAAPGYPTDPDLGSPVMAGAAMVGGGMATAGAMAGFTPPPAPMQPTAGPGPAMGSSAGPGAPMHPAAHPGAAMDPRPGQAPLSGGLPAGTFGMGSYPPPGSTAAAAPTSSGMGQTGALGPEMHAASPANPGHGVPTSAHDGAADVASGGRGMAMTATLPPATMAAPQSDAPPQEATPSQEWGSPDRPELSPEHVALLTWWADMIASGQFPAPTEPVGGAGGSDAPAGPNTPAKAPRTPRSGPSRGVYVGIGLAVVAAAGLAVAFGPSVAESLLGDDPAPAPAPQLQMPASVGDLVSQTGQSADAQLQTLIGLGLRPTGTTVTAAYGTDPASPVVLGAMATLIPSAQDEAQRLATWTSQAGIQVGEVVPGSAQTAGIACASTAGTDAAPAGSVCAWSSASASGRSYVVAADTAAALERTAELRSAM